MAPNRPAHWALQLTVIKLGLPTRASIPHRKAMTKALDERLAISRLPGSPFSHTPTNSTGVPIVEIAIDQQDPLNYVMPGQPMIGTTITGTDDGTKNGGSVVDTDCKVYGIGKSLSADVESETDILANNLFVVDAGMPPDLPTGNTMAIVMVAAEYAAQKIIALDSPLNDTWASLLVMQ